MLSDWWTRADERFSGLSSSVDARARPERGSSPSLPPPASGTTDTCAASSAGVSPPFLPSSAECIDADDHDDHELCCDDDHDEDDHDDVSFSFAASASALAAAALALALAFFLLSLLLLARLLLCLPFRFPLFCFWGRRFIAL